MSYQVIQFDVFNPIHLTHWFIVGYQLLRREKYWWIVHVTMFINDLELYMKVNSIALIEKQKHDRELLWYPLSENSERRLMLDIQSVYFVNCAYVVSSCTDTETIYYTPASLYEAALDYTDAILTTDYTNCENSRTPSN